MLLPGSGVDIFRFAATLLLPAAPSDLIGEEVGQSLTNHDVVVAKLSDWTSEE